LHKYPN